MYDDDDNYNPGPYFAPEMSGLEQVAHIELSDGAYQYQKVVAWREIATGRILVGRDSGCSCPSPFENHTVDDLEHITSRDGASRISLESWDGGSTVGERMTFISEVMTAIK